MGKRALSPAALSPCTLSPCSTLSSRPLFFPRSKRPRPRPRVGCVARGWESQSRAKLSKPCGAPVILEHACDVDTIEDMISGVTGRCRVDDTWHSPELNRAADEAVQHRQASTRRISLQLPLLTAAACAGPAEATSSGPREHTLQLQRRTSDVCRSGFGLTPLPFHGPPTLMRTKSNLSNLDELLERLIR